MFWVPDVRDSILPFLFGALELSLNHTIMLSLWVWLVTAALIPITAAVNIWLIRWRANEEDENFAFASWQKTQPHESCNLLSVLLYCFYSKE